MTCDHPGEGSSEKSYSGGQLSPINQTNTQYYTRLLPKENLKEPTKPKADKLGAQSYFLGAQGYWAPFKQQPSIDKLLILVGSDNLFTICLIISKQT